MIWRGLIEKHYPSGQLNRRVTFECTLGDVAEYIEKSDIPIHSLYLDSR